MTNRSYSRLEEFAEDAVRKAILRMNQASVDTRDTEARALTAAVYALAVASGNENIPSPR